MQFVGNKNDIYPSVLPAIGKFPELKVADFQTHFHFLSNETESAILRQLSIARLSVNAELYVPLQRKPNPKQVYDFTEYADLTEYSLDRFGDDTSAPLLYEQAVFAFAASMVIGVQISNDTTGEAASRQDALSDKHDHCLSQYRRALDLLINQRETLTFEVL